MRPFLHTGPYIHLVAVKALGQDVENTLAFYVCYKLSAVFFLKQILLMLSALFEEL